MGAHRLGSWSQNRVQQQVKGGKIGSEKNWDNESTRTSLGPVEQSSVLMVYGLDLEKLNCDKLFNLLCLYGNVLKIKFLKTKSNTAMAQMCTPGAVDRACQWLNGVKLFTLEL